MWRITHDRRGTIDKLTDLIVRSDGPTTTRALVVEGGEGVGKSHLLREGVALAREQGLQVLGPLDGRDLTDCPSCCDGVSPPPPRTEHAGPAVTSLDVPLFVAVDDAHLADPDQLTREIRHLNRNHRASVTWLVTVRPPHRLTAVPVDEVSYAALADLPDDAVARLVTEMLDAPPSAALSTFLAQAGGNPRMMTALLTGLAEEGALHQVDGRIQLLRETMPERVTQLVRGRLNALSPRCRRMLQMAAVLDEKFCPIAMASFMTEPVTSLLPLFEEAIDAGLIRTGDGPRLAFCNTLLWRAIRDSAPTYLHAALQETARHRPDERPPLDTVWTGLAENEQLIARLAGEGLTNQQIARRVYLSPHTVNYHLRRIFRKLKVNSRIELAKMVADFEPVPRTSVKPGI
ncbi:LuxR C-terminal-related transcriptional regulator [Plantactinospora sp. B5E13]|uniref:LuxR C-terminal-related transcriptional regulator n=1 Tax=unclassified Plantactinospora TaxID=2631981 RepID=UPI00325E9D45